MIKKISSKDIFFKDYGWHSGYFNFEFGDYHDPHNRDFGVLAALNDFSVQPGSGFETHPHSEVEIISYCIEGQLQHKDNMGNENALHSGDSQYTCAGSGITHSEMNTACAHPLRFLQIWIKPRQPKLQPQYRIRRSIVGGKMNHFHRLASGERIDGILQVQQDVNIYIGQLQPGNTIGFQNRSDRQSYIYCMTGSTSTNGLVLGDRDAMKVWGEEDIRFETQEQALVLMVEMAKA